MEFSYTNAELKAIQVLNDCGLQDSTEMPLDEIIFGRKAFYEEVPLENKDGQIISVNGKSIISINSNIPFETKKRFAAAHELGHYEMHQNLRPIYSDTEENFLNWYKAGSHETQANQFAAEFLMPSKKFYKECERKVFNPDIIIHLSNRFHVSKTAAILKFVERGNHPIFIVYCKDNKMKWWKKSHDFYHYSLFEFNMPPPSGSVAYEIFTKNKVYKNDESKQDVWKSDWFKMRNDEERDSRFFEYCLYSKAYNFTLSVIWEK